jgi:hypothetical protein
MIPGKIIRFLEERASVAFAGTRDRNLVPQGHRVTGWLVGPGGRTLTIFIAESSVPHLVEALHDNGRIAVTFEEVATHETYQLKGRYLGHRLAQSTEIEISTRLRDRFVKSLHSLFAHQEMGALLGPSIGTPGLVVEFEVHEVFLQTPGPGAGSRLAPPPDVEVSAT